MKAVANNDCSIHFHKNYTSVRVVDVNYKSLKYEGLKFSYNYIVYKFNSQHFVFL